MMETTVWDVVVIGAGPAGSLAAFLLARTGRRVLLLERKEFPRDKVCGGCLNGRALAVLARSGLSDVCDELGATTIERFRLYTRTACARLPLPAGRALSRAAFDHALALRAIKAGASWLERTSATVLNVDNEIPPHDLRGVRIETAGSAPRVIQAHVVLVADGLSHPSLSEVHEFDSHVEPGSRIGVGGTLPDNALPLSPNDIHMSLSEGGYVGAARIEGNRWNIAAALDREFVKRWGVGEAIREIWRQTGCLPENSLEFPEGTWWSGTLPLTRRTPRLSAARLFLLGDATGYLEPFTGEGMAWAMASAHAVVPIVEQSLENPEIGLTSAWRRRYDRVVWREQAICRGIIWLARRPRLAGFAVGAVARHPRLVAPLLRYMNHLPKHVERWL